jgi:hypothetical protein
LFQSREVKEFDTSRHIPPKCTCFFNEDDYFKDIPIFLNPCYESCLHHDHLFLIERSLEVILIGLMNSLIIPLKYKVPCHLSKFYNTSLANVELSWHPSELYILSHPIISRSIWIILNHDSHQLAFEIDVIFHNQHIHHTIFDEGASTCVMSLYCWKGLKSHGLNQSPTMLKAFDGRGF